MPTLQFKGKSFVQNHHISVKFHQLVGDKKKSLTDKLSLHDNLIVQGDNLKALKALLPTYAGKVKCIYIDPPYNTGNEKWVYNDNVNSPMMQEWLGTVVDKDDLTRHDKWLCMMMPRLKLLKELLAEDGAIFVSIDDNECARLRLLLDEVFGEDNHLNTFCWVNNLKGRQISGSGAVKTYESIIAYAKKFENIGVFNSSIEKLKAKMPSSYKGFDYATESDEDGEFVVKNELYNTNSAFNEETRPNLVFNIHYNIETKEIKYSDAEKNVEFPGFTKIKPKENNDGVHRWHAWRWSKKKIDQEQDDLKFLVGKNGIRIYTKIRQFSTTIFKDIITDITTKSGGDELKDIFGSEKAFEYPKPSELIEFIVGQLGPDAVVLDSFSGSGTTAHAVLKLNKEDGGNRRFILVEMEDYADTITAERVRRVIKGVPKSKNFKEGTGGTFSYFKLGPPIEMEQILHGKSLPSYEDLARYVFFTATGEEFNAKEIGKDKKKPIIGTSKEYPGGVYLYYEPNMKYLMNTALTLDMAKALGPHKNKRRLVFAPMKYLDQDYLDQLRMDYSQLPFEIYRFKE